MVTETETQSRVEDHYKTDEVGLLRSRYHAAPIDFIQTGRGRLGANVHAVSTAKIELRQVHFDAAILNVIEKPLARFGVAFGINGNPRLFGKTLTSYNLCYINGRNGVFAQIPADGSWLNLTMDQAWLQEMAAVHDYSIPAGDDSIGLPADRRTALIGTLKRIVRLQQFTGSSNEQLEDAVALLVLRVLNAMNSRRMTLNTGKCWAAAHEAIAYIRANYAKPMTLTKLCQMINVSERTLRYHFLKTVGMSPHQYLTHYRLHKAYEMLVEDRVAKVADAALACGIPHTGRFSQYFKAMFGESPSQVLRKPTQMYREPKTL